MGPVGRQGKGGTPLPETERKVRFCFIRVPCQLGSPRDRKTKVLVTGISLYRGHVGESGTGLVYNGL